MGCIEYYNFNKLTFITDYDLLKSFLFYQVVFIIDFHRITKF